tara:strand:+ start:114 stop:896 length:783 start_codon:yes stop_codon:yes gene_type:complete
VINNNQLAISLLLLMLLVVNAYAQTLNPLEADPRAARAGGSIFRAQCATCHGADAKGISTIDAPDLTMMWSQRQLSEEGVFQIIRDGISGSIMPPHSFPDTEIWMLVSFLRSVAEVGISNEVAGDSSRGAQLFARHCSDCHRSNGNGGSLGPDLSNITARRSLSALISSIRNPSVNIARFYKPVSFITMDNESVQGTIKSEDVFSIQMMDRNQVLRGFTKSNLRELRYEQQSLMPIFAESSLSNTDVDDLISYLQLNRSR